jgi:hypothetical protein
MHQRQRGSLPTVHADLRQHLGDGVRIVGSPGGSASFTSIGELEVYFDG